jgi:formylglycine-generating enzyme required for sulfatase activity
LAADGLRYPKKRRFAANMQNQGGGGSMFCRSVGWAVIVGLAAVVPWTSSDSFAAAPKELPSSLAPSIHVPPVRTAPPRLTKPIQRPEQYDPRVAADKLRLAYRMESLRLAIEDLIAAFGDGYPRGAGFLQRWDELNQAIADREPDVENRFTALRRDSMLANPLIDADELLVLKRKKGQLGLPTNHQCNPALQQNGYDNELAVLPALRSGGQLRTLYRPTDGSYVGEMDLDFGANRLLFTMPVRGSWQIHEIRLDGSGLRQVSREVADTDHFDACYLPDGRIVFASTASFTGVPCWHGRERACCLYSMDADGGNMRQLCYDQDLDLHPSVLASGQVIYSRWDYTGLLHAYVRPLMAMNPDGTGQRAVYGSNSYYPNSLFFPQQVPGNSSQIAAILAGYHGRNRMGELVVLDVAKGWSGADGVVHRFGYRGEPTVPVALDALTVNARYQFLHPYPLSDKYIIAAMQARPDEAWGIYLVDAFDNMTPLLTHPDYDFFEPILVRARPRPPVVPSRIDPEQEDAVVVVHDVYQGAGLQGVPRGVVQQLRIAAYHYGYPGMAGPDKIGRGGPWEVMRILGTVPVYPDGSAKFRVPANIPITLQALDGEGRAVQLMRSWYTAMPGETASCIGCHESPGETPKVRRDLAMSERASEIRPWYGPARGFDFEREVQPVLNQHCVGCHDGRPLADDRSLPDLRDRDSVGEYRGLPLSKLGATRLDRSIPLAHPDRFSSCENMPAPYGGLRTHYSPAYEALIPYIRRVNIEDDANLLRPSEYHANTSELIQMLEKGHHTVQLDREAWDRLVTWIDLNGPCHGTWGEVAEIPGQADRRRHELAQQYGGSKIDPEAIPDTPPLPSPMPRVPCFDLPEQIRVERLAEISRLLDAAPTPVAGAASETKTVALPGGTMLQLVRIPAGAFVMGDTTGEGDADEWPASLVQIDRGFWIGRFEITNEQFRVFFPEHDSGFFTKRQIEYDGPGVQLDGLQQPAVRVSWNEAVRFCQRLSQETGLRFALPTESQWEYAARAGTVTALHYGDTAADFTAWANAADRSLTCLYTGTAGVVNFQPLPADMRFDDGAIGTAPVGSYRANAWGLYDMHGNAAEWTRSAYRPYPYDPEDGRNDVRGTSATEPRVVRGGSFADRPSRCRSSFRLAYPAWQPVYNVGFRVVLVEDHPAAAESP